MSYPYPKTGALPYTIQPPGKITLSVLQFPDNVPTEKMLIFGEQYVQSNLRLHGEDKAPIPFCSTIDSIPVYFFDNTYHFLRRNTGQMYRTLERSRIQRLHWLVPAISGTAKGKVFFRDDDGNTLGNGFRGGVDYRLFWLPQLKYTIILVYEASKTRFKVLTAFRVIEPPKRKMFDTLFPK
jgi:hypothetical protein